MICVRAGSQVALANPNRTVARGGGSRHPPRRPNLVPSFNVGTSALVLGKLPSHHHGEACLLEQGRVAAGAGNEPAEPRGERPGRQLGLPNTDGRTLLRSLPPTPMGSWTPSLATRMAACAGSQVERGNPNRTLWRGRAPPPPPSVRKRLASSTTEPEAAGFGNARQMRTRTQPPVLEPPEVVEAPGRVAASSLRRTFSAAALVSSIQLLLPSICAAARAAS